MMRISIKARIALWYALWTLLIFLLTVYAAWRMMCYSLSVYDQRVLSGSVELMQSHIRYEEERPILPREDLAVYHSVRFAILDEKTRETEGDPVPFALPPEELLRQTQDDLGHAYYVLDTNLRDGYWLRGFILRSDQYLLSMPLSPIYYFIPLVLVLSALGGYFVTRRMLQPVRAMADRANAILNGDDLSLRFDEERREHPDELGRLAAAFNRMMARLEEAFALERQYSDEVAHDLRTPLAVVRSAGDEALLSDDPAAWREALQLIARKTQEMARLVDKALTAARLDNGGEGEFLREHVDFSCLVEESVQEVLEGTSLAADVSGVQGGIAIEGDEMLLTRLVVQLTENAQRYAVSCVRATLTQGAGAACLVIEDDGPGFPPDALEDQRMFQRFWRGPDGGTGLGLAMASRIVQLHGGVIRADNSPGARVTVTLPQAIKPIA